jgi:Flp pilus assembly pilin Flp
LKSPSWTKRGQDIDGEAANDHSGFCVSLSDDGNTVAIGARFNDGTASDAGHVRVYDWDGTAWTKRGRDIDGEASSDYSGRTVSLSDDGNTVAIGAPQNDGTGSNAGHVRVYDWDGTAWTKRGRDIDGEAANDHSGFSVYLSGDGNTVAIGARFNDDAFLKAGHVRVYDWVGTAWTKRGQDIEGEAANDESGYSVSLSDDGNTVAIGAPFNDGTASDAGHVRVYDLVGTAWTKRGQDIDGEASSDYSGRTVSLSANGDTVAIGAPQNDGTASNAGHVRVYDWDGTNWNKRGQDIEGEAANDESGYSVSLSDDGNTVAIGARLNGGAFSNAGHVRVYDWVGTAWTKRGQDIEGEGGNDESGYSVSLSDDGNTVAIGAPFNDGTASDAGHVRVYHYNR